MLEKIYYILFQILFWFVLSLVLAGFSFLYFKLYKKFFEFFLFPLFLGIPILFRWNYVKKNSQFNSNKNHIAIILANNYYPWRYMTYGFRIDKLIKYFKRKNLSYKVYSRVNEYDIKKIINNKNTKGIILIGHGQRHGIKIGKNKIFYYCEVIKAPKKDFVIQLHCNHFGGFSLVDYLAKDKKKSFVTDKTLTFKSIEKFIDEYTKQ